MPSKVPILRLEQLLSMHTGTLLSRRRALLECEESFAVSDRAGYEEAPNPDVTGYIEFKDTSHWKKAYRDLKTILAKREHIPTGEERKAARQERGRARRR